MPANVENMFSVKETPWHGIGVVINEAPTLQDAIKLAGLDWLVLVESLTRPNGINVDEFAKAFIRSDNNKTLGVVGPKTHPLQNVHAFDFFQPFVDSKEASLETAGALDEGRRVWVMAKLNRDNSTIVKNDEIAKFVLLSNSHDGSLAVRVGFTPIRVVCANTLAMAHSSKASKLIRVRHSKDVQANVEAVRDTMNLANEEFEATAEQFRFLASRQINATDLKKYVKIVMGMPDEKMTTRAQNILNSILERHEADTGMVRELLARAEAMQREEAAKIEDENQRLLAQVIANTEAKFEAGRGTENAASRGTYWTAYNAVNEYLNYEKGHNPDTRLNSLWFGQNAGVNNQALEVALKLANGETVG